MRYDNLYQIRDSDYYNILSSSLTITHFVAVVAAGTIVAVAAGPFVAVADSNAGG